MNVLMDLPISRQDISEELIDQELFLYDEGTGSVHQLNSGAAMIWLLCDGTKDVASIAVEIAKSSNVDAENVLQDVQEALQKFDSLGLLVSS